MPVARYPLTLDRKYLLPEVEAMVYPDNGQLSMDNLLPACNIKPNCRRHAGKVSFKISKNMRFHLRKNNNRAERRCFLHFFNPGIVTGNAAGISVIKFPLVLPFILAYG
ncbi:MAG: hypothetical protein DI535_25680 [Citrobacter freundii]|nr:MAG: hypothetical protein DI535_25680 [Citrobacter freundii]